MSDDMRNDTADFTPDELYRALISSELRGLDAGPPDPESQRLFDELVDRREPDTDRLEVATALQQQLDAHLHLVLVTAGIKGMDPLTWWAMSATEMAGEDGDGDA